LGLEPHGLTPAAQLSRDGVEFEFTELGFHGLAEAPF
jgi:hypothetical protein